MKNYMNAIEECTGEKFEDWELKAAQEAMDEYFAEISFSPPQQAEDDTGNSQSETGEESAEDLEVITKRHAEMNPKPSFKMVESIDWEEKWQTAIASPPRGSLLNDGKGPVLVSTSDPLHQRTKARVKPKDQDLCVPAEQSTVGLGPIQTLPSFGVAFPFRSRFGQFSTSTATRDILLHSGRPQVGSYYLEQ